MSCKTFYTLRINILYILALLFFCMPVTTVSAETILGKNGQWVAGLLPPDDFSLTITASPSTVVAGNPVTLTFIAAGEAWWNGVTCGPGIIPYMIAADNMFYHDPAWPAWTASYDWFLGIALTNAVWVPSWFSVANMSSVNCGVYNSGYGGRMGSAVFTKTIQVYPTVSGWWTLAMHQIYTDGWVISGEADFPVSIYVTVLPPTPVLPTISSPTHSAITETTATIGATVTSDGGSELTARGTCWGTTPAPTTNCLNEGNTTVSAFTQNRTGFSSNTTYYYRGFASNSVGIGYSADNTFTTPSGGVCETVTFPITDVAGMDAYCSLPGYTCTMVDTTDWAGLSLCYATCPIFYPGDPTCFGIQCDQVYMHMAVTRCPAPNVLELCTESGGIITSPYDRTLVINSSEKLRVFYDNTPPQCNGSEVTGTWAETPSSTVSLSGTSPKIVTAGSAPGAETVTVSYGGSSININYTTNCSPKVCSSSEIVTETNKYCSNKTISFNNGCNSNISCPGTRTCDFNWKEVAP